MKTKKIWVIQYLRLVEPYRKSLLGVIFGFLTWKLIKVPIFIKIQWTKLKIWTKTHYHQFPRWPPRGQKRRIVAQTFNRNTSETIWGSSLKVGTFTYLHSVYFYLSSQCSKFHWNLRRWVSGMSHFDMEFPTCVLKHKQTWSEEAVYMQTIHACYINIKI